MVSIRWRLTLFHAAAIFIITVLLFSIFFIAIYRGVTTSVEETARARAAAAVQMLVGESTLTAADLAELAEGDVYVVIRDRQGAVIAETAYRAPGLGEVSAEERAGIWQEALSTGRPVIRKPRELYVYALPVDANASQAAVVEAWKSYDATAEAFLPDIRAVTFAIPAALILAIGGSYLLARSALSPVNAIVRTARDISDRDLTKRLPVSRPRDELGQLSSTFNDLLARLEIAFRQREDALNQQRRFVADASHELRTPLTSIQGYARMLRQWALDDPETARESVEAIEREAARMSALVEDLLLLARGDEGSPLAKDLHDLRDIAAASVETARAKARGRLDIRFEQPPAPVVAEVDRRHIQQLVDILLDNALKYTPEGGTVTVTVRQTSGHAEISVADNGIGIPEEHQPHIFDRFYRVEEARTGGGEGLGLAIARQIAEQHDGRLTVDSIPGQGSTFTLSLPV